VARKTEDFLPRDLPFFLLFFVTHDLACAPLLTDARSLLKKPVAIQTLPEASKSAVVLFVFGCQ
jgi:hypothetical protein